MLQLKKPFQRKPSRMLTVVESNLPGVFISEIWTRNTSPKFVAMNCYCNLSLDTQTCCRNTISNMLYDKNVRYQFKNFNEACRRLLISFYTISVNLAHTAYPCSELSNVFCVSLSNIIMSHAWRRCMHIA